ncbi:hypothetical protein ACFQ3N_11675 [Virgibacillus byunsanensis]|uniref:Uncharacterized protein n=1 Tax=Virgibacillus byunsanensis TaxID=570945 RepID=A0ABW3LLY4_9BACI
MIRNKKDPNNNSSLSVEETNELNEDYLSHGSHDEHDDRKNI